MPGVRPQAPAAQNLVGSARTILSVPAPPEAAPPRSVSEGIKASHFELLLFPHFQRLPQLNMGSGQATLPLWACYLTSKNFRDFPGMHR